MDPRRLQQVRDRLAANDPRGALDVLDRDGAAGAGDADAAYLRSVSHFRLGDFVAAETHARNAVSLNASHAAAFYYLGLATERQNCREEALAAYRVVLALDPTHQKAREKLEVQDGPAASAPRAPHPPAAGRPAATELTLPGSDDEFATYEPTRRRKALIDARADYDAQLRALPGWVKVLMWVVALVVVAVFAWVAYGFFTVSELERQQGELQQQICEQAAEQGVELPDC